MSEKRFIPMFESRYGNVVGVKDNGVPKTISDLFDLANELHEENQQLREILKLSCVMEICENCKHGEYWVTQDYWTCSIEGEFKCHKGHPPEDRCELRECEDFELKELDKLLEEL